MPRASAAAAMFRAGSIPRDRDAARDEVTEQVAVVAGDLDDARRSEPEPVDHRLDEAARVLHPAVGVRREVGVLAEDVLGGM